LDAEQGRIQDFVLGERQEVGVWGLSSLPSGPPVPPRAQTFLKVGARAPVPNGAGASGVLSSSFIVRLYLCPT